LIMMFYDK